MTTVCLEAEAMRALVSLSIREMIADGRGSPCAGQLVNCIILTTRVSVKCSAMTASFLKMMSPCSVTFSLSLLRQFHSHNTDQFLGYMGQYVRSTAHSNVSSK